MEMDIRKGHFRVLESKFREVNFTSRTLLAPERQVS